VGEAWGRGAEDSEGFHLHLAWRTHAGFRRLHERGAEDESDVGLGHLGHGSRLGQLAQVAYQQLRGRAGGGPSFGGYSRMHARTFMCTYTWNAGVFTYICKLVCVWHTCRCVRVCVRVCVVAYACENASTGLCAFM